MRFCHKRRTAEQWIKEDKQAAHFKRLSSHRFLAHGLRLQLSVLVYKFGNQWRRLLLLQQFDV